MAKFLLLNGRLVTGGKTYKRNQVVVSDDDLAALHGADKFKLIEGTPKVKLLPTASAVASAEAGETVPMEDESTDGLEQLSFKELKERAVAEGVDASAIRNREGVIAAIRNK